MANYDQLNQELETLKSKFMLLDTDEERKAFRSEVTAFIDSKSDEEKQLVNEAFIAGANDACDLLVLYRTYLFQQKQGMVEPTYKRLNDPWQRGTIHV